MVLVNGTMKERDQEDGVIRWPETFEEANLCYHKRQVSMLGSRDGVKVRRKERDNKEWKSIRDGGREVSLSLSVLDDGRPHRRRSTSSPLAQSPHADRSTVDSL